MCSNGPTVPECYKTKTALRYFRIEVNDGHAFYVNPHFLAEHSPVFEKLFFGEFKEAREHKAKFEDETVGSMSMLLKVLQNGIKDVMKPTSRSVAGPNATAGILAAFFEMIIDYGNADYKALKWTIIDYLTEQTVSTLVSIKLWEKVKDSNLTAAIFDASIKNCDIQNTTRINLPYDEICGASGCKQMTRTCCTKCQRCLCHFHYEKCSGKYIKAKVDRKLFKSV